MQAGGGCNFRVNIWVCVHTCFCALANVSKRTLLICMYMHVCHQCVSVHCGTLPSCLPDSTYSSFTLLCSFSLPSPLPLFPLPLPSSSSSSPSHSARLARTCMSVDSVLCLLPWHAPTSLQCSPVCINWQRDSGYVVCRAGREERKKKGEARRRRRCKDAIVTITDRQTDGQAVWQVHIGTDRQTNRICCAECAKGDYLTVYWLVCKRTGGVCICLFALVCLRMCVSRV